MKRLAIVAALVAVGACQKPAQQPASSTADTSHMMAADTTKKMGDTSHMMMADTSKKMAPATAPAKTAPKKP